MTTSAVYQLLASIAERLDGQYPGITASIQLGVGEGDGYRSYCLVIERGVCRVEAGGDEVCTTGATATIKAQEQDAIDLLTGKLEPDYALHAGKLEVGATFLCCPCWRRRSVPTRSRYGPC